MLEADQIVDLLTVAGALALVALPVAVLVIGVLVWINRRRARTIREWRDRHGDLKRRLADVEALRAKDGQRLIRDPQVCTIPPAGWRCTRAPGHDGPCAAVPDSRYEYDARAMEGVVSREMAERLAKHEQDRWMRGSHGRGLFGGGREEGECPGCGTTGWGSDHDEDCPVFQWKPDPDEKSDLPVTVSPPHIPDTGEDGTDVRDLIRTHLGEPPFPPCGPSSTACDDQFRDRD